MSVKRAPRATDATMSAPVHDAGVEVHLHVGADLAHDVRQQVEGDRRAVELAAAVVREHDAVDALAGEDLRVLDGLHALDDDLAGPDLADDVEVVEGDGRVHRGVEQLADGAAGRRERGELELRGREEVDPPRRAGDRVDDGAGRQLRRDREAVALVAQAGTGDGRVDREEQGVEAGGCRAARRARTRSRGRASRRAGTSCGRGGSRPSRPRSRSCRASRA